MVWATLVATVWISLSEFVRNEFLLKSNWSSHYQQMGLDFPDAPINGAIWGVWSLCFAIVIALVSQKFTYWQSVALCWFIGFVLMWLVIGNLSVLPFSILPFAIPLSFVEVAVAAWIIRKIAA